MKTLFRIVASLVAGIAAVALTVYLVERFLDERRDTQYIVRDIE